MKKAEQVEKILRDRVTDGTYQMHHVIPTQAELSVEFGVHRSVVAKAGTRLVKAGILLGFGPRGTVVIDPLTPPTGDTLRVRTQSGQWETWPLPLTQTHRIRVAITSRIKDGTYPEGSKIPGAKTLAKEFAIPRGPARNAIDLLVKRGLLCTTGTSSHGTFVHPTALRRLKSAEDSTLTSTGTGSNGREEGAALRRKHQPVPPVQAAAIPMPAAARRCAATA